VESRQKAIRELLELERLAAPAIPELIECLSDAEQRIRAEAIVVLGKTSSKSVVRPLVSHYYSNDSPIDRLKVMEALAELGELASDAVPDMLVAFEDMTNKSFVRLTAAAALGEVGAAAEPALPALRQSLAREKDYSMRRIIETAIRRIEYASRQR
jgi:HEAT repeat protein